MTEKPLPPRAPASSSRVSLIDFTAHGGEARRPEFIFFFAVGDFAIIWKH
jgi:hypothetical protein